MWTYSGSHLAKVCRQLRHEALGYIYSVSSFVLPLRYVLQAQDWPGPFLRAKWEHFVHAFSLTMMRQIKRMIILVGRLDDMAVFDEQH